MHNVSPFADLLTLQNEMREGFVPPAVVENSRDAEIEELNQRLAESKAYADKCKNGCVELSFALSKIDYMCGPPNEMEVSGYCVHQNEEAVVDAVKHALAEKDARIEALSGALDDAISLLDRAVMEETPDDYGETYQAVSDVLAGKALAPKNPA